MQINHNGADGPSNKLYDRLREQDTATLLEGLEEATNDPNNIDSDLITAYLDVLEEKSPVLPPDFNAEEDLETFKHKFAALFDELDVTADKGPQRRYTRKLSRILGCAAAVVIMFVVFAEAFGIPIISTVYQWGADAYRTVVWGPSGSMTLEHVPENEYASLEEALAAYHVEDAVNPHWIPSEFTIESATAREMDGCVLLKGRYLATDGREIFIRVTAFYISADTANNFEHFEGEVVYPKNGVDYVLSENGTQNRASWNTESCQCSINGDISVELLKRLIDSIQ